MKKKLLINGLKVLFAIIILCLNQYVSGWILPNYYDWDYAATAKIVIYVLAFILYTFIFRKQLNKGFDIRLFAITIIFLVCSAAYAAYSSSDYLAVYPIFFPLVLVFGLALVVVIFGNHKHKWMWSIGIVITTALIDYFVVSRIQYNQYKTDSVSDIANIPSFAAKTLDGKDYYFAPQDHRVTMLIVGFIDCLPCRQLEKATNDLVKFYSKDSSIYFIKVNPIDSADRLAAYVEKEKLLYPTIMPKNYELFQKIIGVNTYPITYVLDAQGNVRFVFHSFSPNTRRFFIEEIKKTIAQIP